jgi:succinate-acetate transporter protein
MADSTISRSPIANPGPLGLCGFALTTFVLSCANAGLFSGPEIVIGLALFYGGLAQLLAGMWEFKTGNTFGATAFTSYGAFWLALATSIQFKLIPNPAAMGFFLLGWTVFTAIMLLGTLRTNLALILLFLALLITFVLLTLGEFGFAAGHQLGGYVGILTALIAWYNAAAGILASGPAAFKLPVFPVESGGS